MKKILAIGAHPDDIEIDCAGTISKEISEGNRIFFFILTNGDKGGQRYIRRYEALKSALLLGVEDIVFEDLKDCSLRYDHSLVGRVITTIRKIGPYRIYTHCQKDISPDHAEIGKATILASKDVKEVLAYRGSPQWNKFSPNYFVDIEPFLALKESILQIFQSQNAQDKFGLDYVAANAIYYGRTSNCGIKYAEAFEVVKLVR